MASLILTIYRASVPINVSSFLGPEGFFAFKCILHTATFLDNKKNCDSYHQETHVTNLSKSSYLVPFMVTLVDEYGEDHRDIGDSSWKFTRTNVEALKWLSPLGKGTRCSTLKRRAV